MLFAVTCAGVPVGIVELTPSSLCAGRMVPSRGYAGIASLVRSASAALLAYGLYGPPASAVPNADRRRARAALRAGASLRIEIDPFTGLAARATFVNLVATPADGHVVVVAGFGMEPAGTLASERRPSLRGSLGTDPDR
jgi:hypothetical protein